MLQVVIDDADGAEVAFKGFLFGIGAADTPYHHLYVHPGLGGYV